MTLHDILTTAIDMESRSRQFYRHLQTIVTSPSAVRLFGQLAAEEERHEQVLTERTKDTPDQAFPDDEEFAEFIRSSHAVFVTVHHSSTVGEITELALNRELRARSVYERLAQAGSTEALRELCALLAREEASHYDSILHLREDVAGDAGSTHTEEAS
jgi:rubrerythrin